MILALRATFARWSRAFRPARSAFSRRSPASFRNSRSTSSPVSAESCWSPGRRSAPRGFAPRPVFSFLPLRTPALVASATWSAASACRRSSEPRRHCPACRAAVASGSSPSASAACTANGHRPHRGLSFSSGCPCPSSGCKRRDTD